MLKTVPSKHKIIKRRATRNGQKFRLDMRKRFFNQLFGQNGLPGKVFRAPAWQSSRSLLVFFTNGTGLLGDVSMSFIAASVSVQGETTERW